MGRSRVVRNFAGAVSAGHAAHFAPRHSLRPRSSGRHTRALEHVAAQGACGAPRHEVARDAAQTAGVRLHHCPCPLSSPTVRPASAAAATECASFLVGWQAGESEEAACMWAASRVRPLLRPARAGS
eukprot:6185780-Pleurochrysis_carterae.AAC.2